MDHGNCQTHEQTTAKDAVIDFIAGSMGAVALVYVGQPLDTIKVKMQTFPGHYRGMIHCFRQTLVHEGIIRGLYAGTTPAIIANVAENSILFAGYGACLKVIANITSQDYEDLGAWASATAGCISSFFSSFALCPTELVKCQLQALQEKGERMESKGSVKYGHSPIRLGPLQLTKLIVQQEGPGGLFRGLSSTLAREMPGYFFFFGGYEATREVLTPSRTSKDDIGALPTMAAGAVGGMMFWIVTFPFDVVKSRIQVDGLHVSMRSLLVKIYKQEGFLALYNGLRPTLIRTIPASATLFLVYEYTKKILHSIL